MSLTIWCNAKFPEAAEQMLRRGTRDHRLVFSPTLVGDVLAVGKVDPTLAEADVALGKPDAEQCMRCLRLKWIEALQSGRLGVACLDVTDPEPLPPEHPLWTAPNCYITSHTAGGRHDQGEAVVRHFLTNLEAFTSSSVLTDRVI